MSSNVVPGRRPAGVSFRASQSTDRTWSAMAAPITPVLGVWGRGTSRGDPVNELLTGTITHLPIFPFTCLGESTTVGRRRH